MLALSRDYLPSLKNVYTGEVHKKQVSWFTSPLRFTNQRTFYSGKSWYGFAYYSIVLKAQLVYH